MTTFTYAIHLLMIYYLIPVSFVHFVVLKVEIEP